MQHVRYYIKHSTYRRDVYKIYGKEKMKVKLYAELKGVRLLCKDSKLILHFRVRLNNNQQEKKHTL